MDQIWLDRDRVDREIRAVEFTALDYDPGSGSYFHDEQPFNGSCVQRYPDGKLANLGEFADGVENGVAVAWHPNGRIASFGELEHGVRHGVLIEWAEDGKKLNERRYHEGRLVQM